MKAHLIIPRAHLIIPRNMHPLEVEMFLAKQTKLGLYHALLERDAQIEAIMLKFSTVSQPSEPDSASGG